MINNSIYLNAEAIGYRALTAISNPRKIARVHSVFDHAFYLQVDKNRLIPVIKDGEYIGPSSILIGDAKDLSFRSTRIKESAPAVLSGRTIILNDSLVFIRLDKTAVWVPPKNPKKRSLLSKALISLNLRVFRDQIYNCPSREGLVPILEKVELAGPINLFLKPQGSNFADQARPYIERLMWGLHWGDAEMALSSASSMLGLGPGLTPSCDDFLAGLMVSLTRGGKTLIGGRKNERNFYKILFREICKAANRKTTTYSNHLLAQARGGEGNKATIELIHAILTEDVNRVADCTSSLINIGETSGGDIAVGVYYGIRFLISKLELSELEQAGDI